MEHEGRVKRRFKPTMWNTIPFIGVHVTPFSGDLHAPVRGLGCTNAPVSTSKEAKLHYCGWQEVNHEKPLENYDRASEEGTCPLCGRLARPMDELKNLHPEILL